MKNTKQIILAIETSCDETATAIYHSSQGLLAHKVYSQTIHSQYGGVVPELASRDHIRKLLPLIQAVITEANINKTDITTVAYTAGPGLVGALLTGASLARSFAWAWQIPALAIHHMEAHLLAPLMESTALQPPFIALLVSGGHTLLVKVETLFHYQILGESVDDAVGEAFDKTAKLLGLAYPGGPEIAKLAKQGNAQRFNFPRPMTKKAGLDFSFSGLKTHALQTITQSDQQPQTLADIAAAFQLAVVDTLTIKCDRALAQTQLNTLVVAGGVSANQLLRQHLDTMAIRKRYQIYYPSAEFCTDNAAMIAFTAHLRLQHQQFKAEDLLFKVKPRWSLEELATQKN